MAIQTVEALVQGGKASAAPPIGSSLGPLGVNIGQVVQEINRKTDAFKGMSVPVKINVDMDNKTFTIEVGTPPTSQLIIKEAGIQKGSGNPLADKVADLKIEQIIKISKMKEDALSGKTSKERVKEVIGTCNSMGVLVEGVPGREAIVLVNEGRFEQEIKTGKTELTQEELKALAEEKKRLAEEIEKRRSEFESKAKAVVAEMTGKPRAEMKAKMVEAKIPDEIMNKFLPAEEKKEGKEASKGGSAPGAEKKVEKKQPEKK